MSNANRINSDGQLWNLKLDARFSHSSEWYSLPVRLLCLLPHNHVETGRVLVAEDESSVVIIGHRVYMKGSLEIHAIEGCVTCKEHRDLGINHSHSFHLT